MRRTRNDILKAIDYFRQAVARDSEYALAWSALSDALQNAGQFRYLPRLAAWAEAEKAALRAIAVDSMLSEAHLSLGRIRETATWDDAGADAEYRLAIKFNPKSPAAHGYYAGSLAVRGKCDQAVEEASTAVGLDVLDAIANVLLPNTLLFCQRDLDRAEKLYHQLIDLQPDWATAHGQLGLLYLRKGMLDSAAAEFAIGAKLNPSGTVYPARLGYALARLGRRDSALVLLRRLEARLPDPAVFTSLAELRIGLGDTTTALAWLDSAVRSRDLLRGPLLAAMWDPTRSDPRFRAILARVGLTQ
jgi:tetratricopeptide (TPR) repeat protein